ncbi:MAG: manganese-binding transcriptional regulator MntR [Pseudomonadota bacterium]|nr:manganese-binding transcriptional regulator MntR [Pseudomonadota bacterium]
METEEAGKNGSLPAPDQRAENFRQARRARKSEIAEDYVELIADLIDSQGEARAVDIARRLGVSHATVIKTVARLQRDGLVVSKPYRAIFLSDEGRRIAEWSRRRHELVVQFLLAIGVSAECAHADAEGIEHHVSAETLAAFERLIEANEAGALKRIGSSPLA